MAIPYSTNEMRDAPNVAGAAGELVEKAEEFVAFLQHHLQTGFDSHKVQVTAATVGDLQKDLVLRSPLGEVWGRFKFLRAHQGLIGLLDLYAAEGAEDGGIRLDPLHSMAFSRRGAACFDSSADSGWDWDFEGDMMPQAEAARTFARIILLKQRDRVPAA